jgi:hypothetical protein
LNFAGGVTGPGASGTLTIASGATLCLGGTAGSTSATCNGGTTSTTAITMPVFQTYTFNSASTVRYLSDTATTISAAPAYGNLYLTPTLTADRAYTVSNGLTVNGSLEINPTAASGYRLTATLGGNSTVAATGTTTITGTTSALSTLDTGSNYSFSSGAIVIGAAGTLTANNSTITASGTLSTIFSNAGTFTAGGSTLVLSGTGNFTLTTATTFNNLSVTGTPTTSNNMTINGTLAVSGSGNFSPSGGAVTMATTSWAVTNSATLVFSGLTISETPTAQSNVSFAVGGALTVNSGITFAPSGGTITLNNGASIVNNGGATTNCVFQGLTIASGATVTSSTAFSIAGTLTNSSTATFNPTGLITMSAASSGITNSGTSLLFDGGLTISTTPTAQSQYNTSFSVDGTFTIGAGVTFAPTSGTITFTSGSIVNNNNLTFNSLTISTGTVTSGSSFSVIGNWTNNGTFNQSAGTVTFNGSGAQAITGTNNNFTNLSITAASTRTVTITSDAVLSVAANGTLTLTGADASNKLSLVASSTNPWRLQVSTTNPTFNISYIVVDNSDASGYQEIDASDGTNSGTNTTNWNFGGGGPSGCYWVGGTSTAWETGGNWSGCAGVGGVPATSDTVTIVTGSYQPTLSSTVTIAGMTLTSGTLTIAASYTLNNTGNWTNNGGTLTATSGTVNFNGSGAQIISGTTTFYNLSITTSSARTVTFIGGATTISIASNGSLTFQGASNNLLTLRSDNQAVWNLQVSSTNTTVSVTYANVSYSNAAGYKQIVADGGTNVDSGNNTNWLFGTASDQNKMFNFGGLNLEGLNIN